MSIQARIPIPCPPYGSPEFISFSGDGEHVALCFGDWQNQPCPLVRLHSECLTGDVFGSARCDCQAQLHEAMSIMHNRGGVILYLRQEGRGIGLKAKLRAYEKQIREGLDTYAANHAVGHADDERDYTQAVMMLRDLGIERLRLLSNNPLKAQALQQEGIDVVERLSTGRFETPENAHYLLNKAAKGGHQF